MAQSFGLFSFYSIQGDKGLLANGFVSLLMIVPMITFISHNTNEWHHLFYKSMTLDYSEGFPLVTLEKGPLYKLHVAYSYSFFVVGMGMLIQMFRKATPRMRKQIAFMIIGSWGPYGFTLVYLSGIFYRLSIFHRSALFFGHLLFMGDLPIQYAKNSTTSASKGVRFDARCGYGI